MRIILVVLFIVSSLLGAYVMGHLARTRSELVLSQQLQSWQSEIAQQLFKDGNSSVLEKIINYHQQNHKILSGLSVNAQASFCENSFLHHLNHQGFSVGFVQTCYSPKDYFKVMFKTLDYWLFNIILLLTLGLAYFLLERHRQQELLREQQTKHRLELAEFARHICHDMKSPLLSLFEYKRMLIETPRASEKILTMAIERLRLMTVELSQKAQVQIPEELVVDRAGVLFVNLVEEFKLKTKGLVIETEISESLQLYLDSEWVRVISNVLQNSIEALEKHSHGIIRVSLREKMGGYLLEVFDNGPGIPRSVLDKIGQEQITHNKSSGNGLGLLNSIQTSRRLGGNFEIMSLESVGTRVEIVIPKISTSHLKLQS